VAHELFILDACVLIDFVAADETVLSAIAQHLGIVHVASTILDEVDGLDEIRASELGLRVVEPPFEILSRASGRRSGLSFQDQVCLLLAVERGWTCVSNDGVLRRACDSDGVPVLWGLEILALLVEAGGIPVDVAVEVAEAIAAVNPYITADTVARFRARVGSGQA
jgi:hypothetical protein